MEHDRPPSKQCFKQSDEIGSLVSRNLIEYIANSIITITTTTTTTATTTTQQLQQQQQQQLQKQKQKRKQEIQFNTLR